MYHSIIRYAIIVYLLLLSILLSIIVIIALYLILYHLQFTRATQLECDAPSGNLGFMIKRIYGSLTTKEITVYSS